MQGQSLSVTWTYAFSAALALLIAQPIAAAQEYPVKPVRLILPFPAGGGSDLIARVVAQKLAPLLGQPALVDNRVGASGNIAAELVAKAPPEGYSLLFGNSSLSISPAIFRKLAYDPVRDLVPISMVLRIPSSSSFVPTMQEAGVQEHVALQWNGLFAPARTPQAVLDRLYRDTVKVLADPELRQRFEAEGATLVGSTPAEFAAFYKTEAAKWGEVAQKSGTKLD